MLACRRKADNAGHLAGVDIARLFENCILTVLTALLRCHGLHLGNRLHLLRRRLWNRKVRCWYLSHGRPQARLDRQEYAYLHPVGRGA